VVIFRKNSKRGGRLHRKQLGPVVIIYKGVVHNDTRGSVIFQQNFKNTAFTNCPVIPDSGTLSNETKAPHHTLGYNRVSFG
jgi:hypothetical protein